MSNKETEVAHIEVPQLTHEGAAWLPERPEQAGATLAASREVVAAETAAMEVMIEEMWVDMPHTSGKMKVKRFYCRLCAGVFEGRAALGHTCGLAGHRAPPPGYHAPNNNYYAPHAIYHAPPVTYRALQAAPPPPPPPSHQAMELFGHGASGVE